MPKAVTIPYHKIPRETQENFVQTFEIQYRPAKKKVPNINRMLTFWRTLRKLGKETRFRDKLYIKSCIIAYAQGGLEMAPQ